MPLLKEKGYLIFDGYCNLCSRTVRFLIKADKRNKLVYFAATDTLPKSVESALSNYQNIVNQSIIFIREKETFIGSRAVIEIIYTLGGCWKCIIILRIIPLRMADAIYYFVARNRYRWFGKRTDCFIPEKAKSRDKKNT